MLLKKLIINGNVQMYVSKTSDSKVRCLLLKQLTTTSRECCKITNLQYALKEQRRELIKGNIHLLNIMVYPF